MKESIEWIYTEDISLYTRIWTNESMEPKGLLYVIHGSVEHTERYRAFAEFFTADGFVVVAPDLRGHGQTGLNSGGLGYFSDNPLGWELCVHDLKVVFDQCAQWYPELPRVILGHSMGSYLVRCFMKEYPVSLDGVILSGTGAFAKGLGAFGIGLSKLTIHFKGRGYKSKLLTDLVYGSLNRFIKDAHTEFDFLTRDEAVVRAYIEDPLCGYTCSAEFIHELLSGTKKSNAREMFQWANVELPLLIISGEKDPVADHGGKGLKKVVQGYRQYLNKVTVNIYPGARHEVLNETNKEEVFHDIHKWLLHKGCSE